MGVIPILVVVSICVAGGFLVAFLWAARQGQYDDLQAPPLRMLVDDVKSNVKEPAKSCETVHNLKIESRKRWAENQKKQ